MVAEQEAILSIKDRKLTNRVSLNGIFNFSRLSLDKCTTSHARPSISHDDDKKDAISILLHQNQSTSKWNKMNKNKNEMKCLRFHKNQQW